MLMNKEENKRIFDMVVDYTKAYQKFPQTHRKIAKLLRIKDWEAFDCQRAMNDLENFNEERIEDFSLQCDELTNIEKLMKDNDIYRFTVRYLLHLVGKCVGYTHDNDFFSRDAPEAFYWAGFIAADGCIAKDNNNLSMGLSRKDLSHVEKFKIAIKSNKIIENKQTELNGKMYYTSGIRISNSKIKKDIERFNISPRKTDVYYMPDWLVVHPLLHHFIRGYFDGDGSFFIARGTNSLTFSLCGIERFLQQCQEIFKVIGVPSNKIQSKGNTKHLCEIQHRGTDIIKPLFDYMYLDSDKTNRLDRKYNLAKEYLDNKKLERQNNTKGKKITAAKTGKHPFQGQYKITKPDGTVETIKSLRKYCMENNLGQSSMFNVASEKTKEYKGYKCEKIVKAKLEEPLEE